MHIKHIIINGFKSYARETYVGPFDEHFNAITGLNGTGKSNILDSICFVLGVSSLATVRATKLEDLISKHATKETYRTAKVGLVLDNRDKSPGICPIGYEKFDEIIVSRTIEQKKGQKEIVSKYHLNGSLSQKNVVVDLFESVRLDVNNPNFMIMQGRITKVVGMKPKELLQMIEETVGATLYQHKRDKAMHIVSNCDRQTNSMASVLEETIMPAYKLQQKAAKDVKEYEELDKRVQIAENKFAVANYLYLSKKYRNDQGELQKLLDAEVADAQAIEKYKEGIKDLRRKQTELKNDAEKQVNVPAVEKEINVLTRKFNSDEGKVSAVRANKKDAQDKLKKAKVDYNEELEKINQHKISQKGLLEEFEQCNADIDKAEKMVAAANDKLEKITIGNIIDDEGKVVNLQEQLLQVEQNILTLKGPNDLKKSDLQGQRRAIMEKENTLRETPMEDLIERDHKQASAEVQRLSSELRRIDIDPTELPDLENSLFSVKKRLRQVESEISRIVTTNQLRFDYSPPQQGFNGASIHGQVHELFEVLDLAKFGVALEVAAGGTFRQVVVENQQISKLLIAHGRLSRRTTFLPLSQLTARGQPLRQSDLDRKLGPNKAFPAIELVRFDPRYRVLMEHVFGSVVICTDQPVAKVVAYQMHRRAVCLDGDVVDPGGTMQGGTRQNAGQFLNTCQNLKKLKEEQLSLQTEVKSLTQKTEMCKRNSGIVQAHEAAARQLKRCTDLLALTARQTLMEELKILKTKFKELEREVVSVDQQISVLQKQEKKLKHQMQMEKQLQEKCKKETEAEQKRWTKALEQARKKKQSKDKLFREIDIDLKAKDAMLEGFQKDIDEAKANLDESENILKRREEEFVKITAEYNEKLKNLQAAIQAKKEYDLQVDKIEETINKTDQKIHKLDLNKVQRTSKIKQQKEKVEGRKRIFEAHIAQYSQLNFSEDMQLLSSKPVQVLQQELNRLQQNKEDMRARLNFKAAEDLPKTEEGVRLHREMRHAIEVRRKQVQDIVDCLDKTKTYVIQNAYKHINEEFDYMMSTLLPNSHAKLVPVNPNNIADGVTIHVCLSGSWKESLTELSGGQRSLVALSLVLALCLYNPAPFYVLDEIDSALDVNHTANIGYLIKTKFPKVQFICVSLKDGMYTNANVVFSTYFENGTSKVKASMKTSKARQAGTSSASSSAAGPSTSRKLSFM